MAKLSFLRFTPADLTATPARVRTRRGFNYITICCMKLKGLDDE